MPPPNLLSVEKFSNHPPLILEPHVITVVGNWNDSKIEKIRF